MAALFGSLGYWLFGTDTSGESWNIFVKPELKWAVVTAIVIVIGFLIKKWQKK
jgi:hypothetical protein